MSLCLTLCKPLLTTVSLVTTLNIYSISFQKSFLCFLCLNSFCSTALKILVREPWSTFFTVQKLELQLLGADILDLVTVSPCTWVGVGFCKLTANWCLKSCAIYNVFCHFLHESCNTWQNRMMILSVATIIWLLRPGKSSVFQFILMCSLLILWVGFES